MLSYRRGARSASLLLALGIALALPHPAARAADPKPAAALPQAEDLLRAMSTYLAEQKGYSYHAEVEFDQVLPKGPKIRLSGAVDIAVLRPGSLHVDYRDDIQDRLVWFQNGRLTVFDPVAVTYAEVTGPKDIDGMVAKLAESDAHAVLTRGVEMAYYVGVHNVEGVFCHHVVLERPDLDLQIFVEVGDRPLPRKLVFEYPDRLGAPQYTASITEWNLEPPKAEVFEAKVPKDAARVEFLPIGEGR
jgi:hypothetical protein